MTLAHKKEIALAEARLSAPPAERMVRYHDLPQLDREKRMFREFLAVDLAHTAMLVEQGIITRQVGAAILTQLLKLETVDAADFPIDVTKGSFLLQVEAYLFSLIGEDVGGQMHTGRSRIDQGATVRRLYKRNRILEVLERITQMQDSLLKLATTHSRTIMPGYTHMQHAQPWVFGHYLLSFSTRFHDAFERLAQSYARVNRNPLGAVGLAGTSWPLDRQRTTDLLGFSAVLENSKLGREAFYAADAIGALSFVMADLNDLATDLHVWSSFEFGMVETHDAYCGTSSIFPQKKNPTALETIKKAAGASVTWSASALAMFRAEGTGDQAVRELPLIDEALASTDAMLDLAAGVLDTLIVHEKRMQAALAQSWCTASNLADVIVRTTGLSFRQVHHVVARLVRNCVSRDVGRASATAAMLDAAAQETVGRVIGMSDEAVQAALDPRRFVESRVTQGSVAPAEVDRMLKTTLAQNQSDAKWLAAERERVGQAAQELKASVKAIVG